MIVSVAIAALSLVVFLAVLLDVRAQRRRRRMEAVISEPLPDAELQTPSRWRAQIRVPHYEPGQFVRLRMRLLEPSSPLPAAVERRLDSRRWSLLLGMAEILVIVVWAVFIGRALADRDPTRLPHGHDFFNNMVGNFFWDHVRSCGSCALWNGDLNGGSPAVPDLMSPRFHPIVAIPSLMLGAVAGSKMAGLLAMMMAGVGQWWIGRELRLSPPARLWGACMAVAAGHMTGRVWGGLVTMMVSIAAATLVMAAVLAFANRPTRRWAAVLGLSLAALAVSGQAYAQIGIALLSPLTLVLLSWSRVQFRKHLLLLASSAGIAFLVAAPWLLPVLRFGDSFSKDIDIGFSRAQPFRYVPLNLVRGDLDYYQKASHGMDAIPHLYVNYVGWITVGLAIVGALLLLPRDWRKAAYLSLMVVGALWLSSGQLFQWLYIQARPSIPGLSEWAASVRTPSLIGTLAVPPLLALAATMLDWLLRFAWHVLRASSVPRLAVAGRLAAVAVASVSIALAYTTLEDIKTFGRGSVALARFDHTASLEVLDALATPDLQWVQPPLGESYWLTLTIPRNQKIAWLWDCCWADHPSPPPYLEAVRNGLAPPEQTTGPLTQVAGTGIYRAPPADAYAVLNRSDGTQDMCRASGEGGHVRVDCDPGPAGQLIVREHAHADWEATVNGAGIDVGASGQWIAADLPAGTLSVELRFRPWDVWAGVILLFIGLMLAGVWIVWDEERLVMLQRLAGRLSLPSATKPREPGPE